MVDVAIRKTVGRRPLKLVLSAQPLTKPSAGMAFDDPVGFADWAEAEVVSPSVHPPVERFHHLLRLQRELGLSGLGADRRTDTQDALLRRYRAQISSSRLR